MSMTKSEYEVMSEEGKEMEQFEISLKKWESGNNNVCCLVTAKVLYNWQRMQYFTLGPSTLLKKQYHHHTGEMVEKGGFWE